MIDPEKFLIVDDDPQSNLVTRLVLRKLFSNIPIIDFLQPEAALDHILKNFDTPSSPKVILLLDINMPTLSGWEFLARFEKYPGQIKSKFSIFMLSSSVDQSDIQRAKSNNLVIDFIEKPLNADKLKQILFSNLS